MLYNLELCGKADVENHLEAERWFHSAEERDEYKKNKQANREICTNEKVYENTICNKSKDASLQEHQKANSGETSCKLNRNFRSSKNLNSRAELDPREKPYKYSVYHKQFTSNNSLLQQQTIDGKKYYAIIEVKGDSRVHECQWCGRKFKKNFDLKTHTRVHTGEKPYECEICHKRYGQSGSLREHRKTHSTERPFQCDMCDKTFKTAGNLRGHRKIHLDERAFQCEVCGKKFLHRRNLMSHIKLKNCKGMYKYYNKVNNNSKPVIIFV